MFRVKGTGQWVDVLLGDAGEAFSTPAQSHLNDIAQGLDMPIDNLEIVESDRDLREGTLMAIPPTVLPTSSRAKFNEAATDGERIQVIAEVLALRREP